MFAASTAFLALCLVDLKDVNGHIKGHLFGQIRAGELPIVAVALARQEDLVRQTRVGVTSDCAAVDQHDLHPQLIPNHRRHELALVEVDISKRRLLPCHFLHSQKAQKTPKKKAKKKNLWWDSNPQPLDPKSNALSVALQ